MAGTAADWVLIDPVFHIWAIDLPFGRAVLREG